MSDTRSWLGLERPPTPLHKMGAARLASLPRATRATRLRGDLAADVADRGAARNGYPFGEMRALDLLDEVTPSDVLRGVSLPDDV